MKTIRLVFYALLFLVLCTGSGLPAQSKHQATTTLLPMDSPRTEGPNGLLWVQADPKKESVLQFDLSALPRGMQESDFVRCTLRLVAKEAVFDAGGPNTGGQPVIVKGRITDAPGTQSIVSLSPISKTPEKPIALQANDALRKEVYKAYSSSSGNKVFSITLFTESHKASSTFYPLSTDTPPSNAPRLVIEYAPPPPSLLASLSWPQYQHDPEHTGRNPWVPFPAPGDFTIDKINLPSIGGKAASIEDYPLIYGGNIYLISKAGTNYLVCMNFSGKNKMWEKDIGAGTVQRSPVISPQGVLYVVTEKQIAAYDLNKNGEPVGQPYDTSKLSNFTDLTAGNDGSLFLALQQDNVNYIYGFTPKLKPFLKLGPFEKISTVTVSAEGTKAFAQTAKGAVVVDIANPSNQQTLPLPEAWEYYHVPLAGPAGGVMVFSDFTRTANKGNVWGYAATEIWKASGTLIPPPVLGTNGFVYFIQGGKLQGHKYDQIGSASIVKGDGLNTSSNLVMDGANNIYFWNNGKLYGYKPDGSVLFPQKEAPGIERQGEGPEKFIRLMMGPDGTLWANNKNGDALYAFHPVYTKTDLPLSAKDLSTQTAYRAKDKLTVAGDVTLKAGTTTVFQAGSGIGLSTGFRVETGASLLCRTGR